MRKNIILEGALKREATASFSSSEPVFDSPKRSKHVTGGRVRKWDSRLFTLKIPLSLFEMTATRDNPKS